MNKSISVLKITRKSIRAVPDDFEGGNIDLPKGGGAIYQHKAHQFGLFANISTGMVIKYEYPPLEHV